MMYIYQVIPLTLTTISTDWPPMAFSPTVSPVYGGGTLTINRQNLDPADEFADPNDLELTSDVTGRYFVVFEGSRRRHVVSARAYPTAGEVTVTIPGVFVKSLT